jgi:hypothetical protein
VQFYFERIKEGCWLTEDLQELITQKILKCKNLAVDQLEKEKQNKSEFQMEQFEQSSPSVMFSSPKVHKIANRTLKPPTRL